MNGSQNAKSGWFASVLFVLTGFLLVKTGESEKASHSAQIRAANPAETSSRGADAEENDYRKPYLEFIGESAASSKPTASTDRREPAEKSAEKEKSLGELIGGNETLDAAFLIVTVPDPIDSRFGYRFDAIIDSVQMAVESRSWVLDHFWIPWRPSGRPSEERLLRPVPSGKGYLHDTEPGVLLFRKSRKPEAPGASSRQEVLVVLLVGETPTFGVAKLAMTKSLGIVKDYQTIRAKREIALRIVGPIFSGAGQSLTRAISSWLKDNADCSDEKFCVMVRSGAAMKIDKSKFESDSGNDKGPRVTVSFDTTMLHLDVVLEHLFRFLMNDLNDGKPLGKVALLTESDTEFGKGVTRDQIDKSVGPGTNVTVMKFPFHVSQVAVAYDENSRAEDKHTPTLIRPSSRLSIPFDETGIPRDVIPSLSPRMTTATEEVALAKILETISMEDFRYIGIVASDTRDTIFLSDLIRRYCPDVQLFAPIGDLLFGHPRYAQQLRGMIVATPYPLFSMAQRWDPPYEGDRRRHLFSHQSDQGIYNATLCLLAANEPAAANPYPASAFYDSLFDYGLPFDELDQLKPLMASRGYIEKLIDEPIPGSGFHHEQVGPALWFSVVGQRGLWPLKYQYYHPKAKLPNGKPKPLSSDYAFNAKYIQEPLEGRQLIDRFIPLIPQFSWVWGSMFLLLSLPVWLVYLLHLGIAVCSADRVPLLGPFRPICVDRVCPDAVAGAFRWGSNRDRLKQEAAILIGLVVYGFVYWYCVVKPCRIMLWDSPWAVFLDHRLWHHLPPNDRSNARFGLEALIFGHLTLLALAAILVKRVAVCWFSKPRFVALSWLVEVALVVVSIIAICWFVFPWSWNVTAWFQSHWKYEPEKYHSLLFFERAVSLGNGVSPYVPVMILTVVAGLWLWWHLERLLIADRFWGAPDPFTNPWRARMGQAGSFLETAGELLSTEEGGVPIPSGASNGTLAPPRGSRDTVELDASASIPVLALEAGSEEAGPELIVVLVPETTADVAPAATESVGGDVVRDPDELPPPPLMERIYTPGEGRGSDRIRKLEEHRHEIRRLARSLLPLSLFHPTVIVTFGIMTIVLVRLWQRTIPSVDFAGATRLVMCGIWFLAFTVVVVLCRFILLWRAVEAMLRDLARLPMLGSYDRIPPVFSRTYGRYLDQARPSIANLAIPVRHWAAVAAEFDDEVTIATARRYFQKEESDDEGFDADQVRTFKSIDAAITRFPGDLNHVEICGSALAERISSSFRKEAHAGEPNVFAEESEAARQVGKSRTWEGLTNATKTCIDLLAPYWDSTHPTAGYREPKNSSDKETASASGEATNGDTDQSPALRRWIQSAEDLIAIWFVTFISQSCVHLRMMAYFLAVAPILLLLAVSSYPFQPQRFLLVWLWAILVTVVGCVLWVYVQMERDEILSRVSKTSPNGVQIDRTFLTNTLAFVLPLFAAILTQFPFVSDTINQWIEPITRIVK